MRISVCLLIWLTSTMLMGQSITGSISGTVVDESQASVVGASVRVTNVATGAERLMPPELFFTSILGFSIEEVKVIMEKAKVYAKELKARQEEEILPVDAAGDPGAAVEVEHHAGALRGSGWPEDAQQLRPARAGATVGP